MAYKNEYIEKNKDLFKQFKRLLITYNSMYNLTAITDEEEIYTKHFEDSLSAVDFLSFGARVVEIGSGAGFPSVPLKIARPDLNFTLIESTGKKCDFLRAAIGELGLENITVLNMRAEDAARDSYLRESFDFAVARAVARLNTLCEYCIPFVRIGGMFIAYKGEAGLEVIESKKAVDLLGAKHTKSFEYSLGEMGEKRSLIIIEKIRETDKKYPRGQGKERSRPL